MSSCCGGLDPGTAAKLQRQTNRLERTWKASRHLGMSALKINHWETAPDRWATQTRGSLQKSNACSSSALDTSRALGSPDVRDVRRGDGPSQPGCRSNDKLRQRWTEAARFAIERAERVLSDAGAAAFSDYPDFLAALAGDCAVQVLALRRADGRLCGLAPAVAHGRRHRAGDVVVAVSGSGKLVEFSRAVDLAMILISDPTRTSLESAGHEAAI